MKTSTGHDAVMKHTMWHVLICHSSAVIPKVKRLCMRGSETGVGGLTELTAQLGLVDAFHA